ncbi:hypothetical protein [Yoonia sp. 208BN28-4]|uniref:hypothetical protein n=1 Tax=Yoonia sp. 208BN28-4 TaxID=3126505 RepID=UPI00309E5038
MSTLSNYVTRFSQRYDGDAVDQAAFWNLMAMGLSATVLAMHLGWLWFGIGSFAGWQFFAGDAGFDTKVLQTLVYAAACGLCVYLACDARRLTQLWQGMLGKVSVVFTVHWMVSAIAAGVTLGLLAAFGNTGLIYFPALILITRYVGGWWLSVMVAVILYAQTGGGGPAMAVLITYGCAVGAMAWMALRISVEIYAYANWNDVGNLKIVGAMVVTAVIAVLCFVATPGLLDMLVQKLLRFPVLPESFANAWSTAKSDVGRWGDPMVVVMAVAATPVLVPFASLLVFGMGAALGNVMPSAGIVRNKLRGLAAEPTPMEFHMILSARQAAYWRGYALATVIGLVCGSFCFTVGLVTMAFTY